MSLPLLVPPMTMDEEEEFGAVASKLIRQDQRAQASSVPVLLPHLLHKPPSKKRSRKQVILSDDESTTGEKTLPLQMQHTISRGSTSAASNNTVVDAVKSLFDEVKTRKDFIFQLEELKDPLFAEEILLSNKRRVIEVRSIFH